MRNRLLDFKDDSAYFTQLLQDQTQLPTALLISPQLRKPSLQLKVLSSATLERGQIITIDEQGLVSQERRARDGVTYFGSSLPVDHTGNSSIVDDDGATGHPNARNLIDFAIPSKSEDEEKHFGR